MQGPRPREHYDEAFERRFPGDVEAANAAKQVEELMASPGWSVLMGLIDEEADGMRAMLDNVTVLSQAEYAKNHGFLQGVGLFKSIANKLVEHGAKRGERAEQRAKAELERSQTGSATG